VEIALHSPPLTPGETVAGYTLVRHLGSGTVGAVYLARHPELSGPVALKAVRSGSAIDRDLRTRLDQTLEHVGALDHPHLARVRDWGAEADMFWVATDYVDGANAMQWLRDRYPTGMPHDAVLTITAAIAVALDYAHRNGVVHLRVKPTNIMIANPDSTAFQIVLTDLGIGEIVTRGWVHAPDAYSAPEQAARTNLHDKRVDQYGLAASSLRMFAGIGSDSGADNRAGRQDFRELLRTAGGPALDGARAALSRALAVDPESRYPTCRAFVAGLASTGAAEPPITARTPPSTATTRGRKPDVVERAVDVSSPMAQPRKHSAPPQEPLESSDPQSPRRGVLMLAIIGIIVAVALVVGGFLFGTHHRGPSPTGRQDAVAAPASSVPASAGPAGAPTCADAAAAALSQMPLRDRLAQLLMVGVKGGDDARQVVTTQHVGGIFIGSWTDLSMLNNGSLAAIAATSGPLPLAVSVDEEGGRVERLAKLIGEQPSPRVLAQTRTPSEVYDIALDRGRKMHALGITVDFAPVVDVTDAPDDTVIGDRSFGADPQKVTHYAQVYAQGLRDAGVIPVLKHFPGHGHGSGDSHTGQVTTPPLASLKDDDLVPYRTLAAQPPVAVMVGHLQVPGLTAAEPASLSPPAYALLRSGDYGGTPFNGWVFTDDLSSMAAITQRYSVAEAALRALQAGADTALWITTDQVPGVLDRLVDAYNSGDLPANRVDEALRHVVTGKHGGSCGG
jgi:beta-glucosidase-like glycosyl hydrolase/serine/threonine protein kinase